MLEHVESLMQRAQAPPGDPIRWIFEEVETVKCIFPLRWKTEWKSAKGGKRDGDPAEQKMELPIRLDIRSGPEETRCDQSEFRDPV